MFHSSNQVNCFVEQYFASNLTKVEYRGILPDKWLYDRKINLDGYGVRKKNE